MTDSPRWDMSNVFPALDAPELEAATAQAKGLITELEQLLDSRGAQANAQTPAAQLGALLGDCLERLNALSEQIGTIGAYIEAFVSTDSRDTAAARRLSGFEQWTLPAQNLDTRFQLLVGRLGGALENAIAADARAQAHAFMLRETARQAQYLMTEELEELATELNLSGANAWSKLQGTVTSQLTVDFELDGQVQTLPMPALINLHSHPDETVRQRAYDAELAAWESVQEPLAAAMNGIKGTANTLNRRRGRTDALHAAVDDARIDRTTLDAMLTAMADSLPQFRRYFRAKAGRLSKPALAWWDLFAPAGSSSRTYSWPETEAFIVEQFGTFSTDLRAFAQRAFRSGWIDAEQRSGKRGGAFCMDVPGVKESRVLCNFDGTLDQVSTIAHELGHAYHNECMYQAGRTMLQQDTPMTLAETASIMCETIVSEAVLAAASTPAEQLAILETRLIGDAQVIVDIYSRYLFEKAVFERRQAAELSAAELCELMEQAQRDTYGDGLDERFLHRYMWTWKPHYYFAGLSFYNFPYAFGLLFGLGLYAVYQQRGDAFVGEYQELLAATGQANATELAARFDIDISTRTFWDASLALIGEKIDRYCAL